VYLASREQKLPGCDSDRTIAGERGAPYPSISPDESSALIEPLRPLGMFVLKGFSQPQEIFLRTWDQRPNIKDYLGPLLEGLNRDAENLSGFRYVLRKYAPDDFKFAASRIGRAFLLRELINLPCLPYSLEDFAALQRKANNKADYQIYRILGELERAL
jgi:hypothetical protein